VNGKPWISTLGGMIELDDRTYIMGCQHISSRHSDTTTNVTSLADTLFEEQGKEGTSLQDTSLEDTEKPLVFVTDDFAEGLDLPQIPEIDDVLPSIDIEWKHLNIEGAITVGSEWCLLPVRSGSLLPNFVEVTAKSNNDLDQRKRHYLDQVSEPQGGHSACIATGTDSPPSGIVLGNSSFIVAGGTDGLMEVWTVALDDGRGRISLSQVYVCVRI
jgi:hypothetical protein